MRRLPGGRTGNQGRAGLLLAALLLGLATAATADQTDRRLRIGLKVFAAVVAADQGLPARRTEEGALRLLLVHLDEPARAEALATRLERVGTIRNWPLQVQAVALDDLPAVPDRPVAGLFLVQWLNHRLPEAIEFARGRRTLLFSPFKGDVEQGVMSGISVRDRILPYVNTRALEAAGIELKPFFLEVARRHE